MVSSKSPPALYLEVCIMKKLKIALLLVVACLVTVLYAQSGSVTSSVDSRTETSPVWEQVITATWDNLDAGDNVSVPVTINGVVIKVILDLSRMESRAVSGEVEILDNGDNKIFDSADQTVQTDPYFFNVYEPVSGTIEVVTGPSVSSGHGGGSIVVTLRGI